MRNGLGDILRRRFGDGFIIVDPLILVEELSIGRNANGILWFWTSHNITVSFTAIPALIRARWVIGVSDHGGGVINIRAKNGIPGTILGHVLVGLICKRENNDAVCRIIIHGDMSGKRS